MVDFKNNCRSIIDYLLSIYVMIVSNTKLCYQNMSLYIEYYYKVFIRNILFYLFPLESVYIFNLKTTRIEKFNLFDLYSSNNSDCPSRYYITKFHDMKYKNGSFYICGHIYHTSDSFCLGLKKKNNNTELKDTELKEIQSIKITFETDQSTQSNPNYIDIERSDNSGILSRLCKNKSHPKLLDDIIDNMSNDSNIIILIYYYIQTYLKDYRIISNIKIGYISVSDTDSDTDSERIEYIDLDIKSLGSIESNKILTIMLRKSKNE